MSLPRARRWMNHSRTEQFLPMKWRKSMRDWFSSGLPRALIRRSLIARWDFISMGLPLRPVQLTSGLRPRSKIHGTSLSSQRNSQRHTKIPLAMPKRWDLHSTSPLMLRPPLSTAVPEVPDAEISKSSSWLESFAARAAHTATMSATSIVAVYNFQQKVLEFLRDSAAKNNIQNDISLIDDLFQRANSMALEAHIMAHDSGVTATELFTHLHMLRRRSVLEAPTVSLPQRDKDRLLVMEVGGNDLFGPNARQVHEWKRDTDEENVKLIARVFDERNQRDKTKKKPASSESRPPRFMDHRSPLAGLSRPKPKDSYSQKPGQSFRRQPKQSPYKARSDNQSRSQNFNRDRLNVSSSSNQNDSRDQGQRRQEKDPKGPSSTRPFNRRGGGGADAAKAGNRTGQLPVGGKLVHFKETWTQHFPQHYEIVRKVSQGILIAFDDVPPSLLRYPLELPCNNKAADLQHAVQKLRLSQAIEEVMDTTSPGYYSRLFLVPKPDGTFRPIIDLKKLNQFIVVPSFKMETLFSIIAALQPNEWITKIDLKDAYHHILVHVNIRKYFRFVVAGTVYQFRVLPFGLSTAPREFTKTLAPVVHLLRSQGIQVHAYLDDWIIRAPSKELSLLHTQHVLQLLQSLGWTINWAKSMLQPSRILDFLGLHFNLEQALISPPDSFLPTLTEVLSRLSPSTVMSARKVSSIISRMSHFAPFITNGCLHLRFLQLWFKEQWTQHRQSWDTPIHLDSKFLSYLRWFLHPSVMTGVPLRLPDPSLFFTDASLKGWGASWKNQQISGVWSKPESQRHINWLELEAVRLALLHWGPHWSNQTVRVYCDNSTAVAYIRKQGGTHSQALFHKTLELYQLLDQYVITLIPTHLPGARNVTADALSRLSQPSPTEWRLQTETLNKLFYVFGTPLIDMFATAENKVTPIFVSPYPDDRAWAVGALSLSWDDLGLVYAFPPAPIVPKTIQKIQKSWGTTVILIASQHPSRPWHPLLLQLSTRPRIPLTDVHLFQFVPNLRWPQFHRDPKLLDLAAWHLSGMS